MKACLAVMLLAAINLAADAQYYLGYGDGFYSPAAPSLAEYVQDDYYNEWPMGGDYAAVSPYPVYDDEPLPQFYRNPRSKKGKKGGDGWGWPEPIVKNVGWGWNKEQHIILPGPYFQDQHPPTIHIHPKPIHHHGWGWGHGGGGGGGGGGHGHHGGWGWGHGGGGGGGYGGGGGGGYGGGHGGWGWGKQIHHHVGWGWK